MIKYLIIILSLVFLACSQPYKHQKKYQNLPKDEVIVNDIMSKTAQRLKKEKGLIPAGSGAQMMYEVKKLELAFFYNEPIHIEKARELLVYAVETFLYVINEDERIRPYLYNYPFEPKNIEINIAIKNPDYSSIEPGKLSFLVARRGYCQYDTDDPSTNLFKILHKETFAEAKEKLKENHD